MFQIRWGIVSEKLPASWGNDSEKSHLTLLGVYANISY